MRVLEFLSASNDFWGKTFMSYSGEAKMTQNISILTGCSAGATESFVVVPFELIKIKHVPSAPSTQSDACLPCSHYRLQDKKSTYAGPMDALKHIVRKDGLLGLYAGMESTFWRWVDFASLVTMSR
jgi:solute carrier family 25 2-oxodicarboxylate transporter 21